jgi:hypothetical protein
MFMMFIYRRYIIIPIRFHSFLSTQGILGGIKTVDLIVIKRKKDVPKRSDFNIKIDIIFVRISVQSVDKKAI